MAKLAIILHDGSPGPRELRLGRILEFFGVPCRQAGLSELRDIDRDGLDYAVFGSIRAIAGALGQRQEANSPVSPPAAFYAYPDDDRNLCITALRELFGDGDLSLREAPAGTQSIGVTDELSDVAGPMAGVKLSSRLRSEDAVLTGGPVGAKVFATLVSAGDAAVFVRFPHPIAPIFLCTSSHMVDLDQPVARGFYDIKDHFCSVVPLVMFIKFIFPEVAWRAQELGACLIIDDPLLKPRYGFCNFEKLRDLMRGHGFTTNVAFIPWNWRRTSPSAAELFGNEPGPFSVSIHGCDHTAGEFGATSLETLDYTARLAQSRMRNHQARTGIQHDSIMVFPQGVFSSMCPEILKRNGFLAAVNTEILPADSESARTRIRDAWDVAIMTYGAFPIFTRRYAFHGLENFAFDLLLGKPCLIVAHHGWFKDGGAELIELLEKIRSLNCRLNWRPLGQVIRRACRRRVSGTGVEEIEMYGSELFVDNPSDRAIEVRIRKRRIQGGPVSEVWCDENLVACVNEGEYVVFDERIPAKSERRFREVYPEQAQAGNVRRSWRFELAVAVRRVLSEVRDDYVSRSRFLSVPAARSKGELSKAT